MMETSKEKHLSLRPPLVFIPPSVRASVTDEQQSGSSSVLVVSVETGVFPLVCDVGRMRASCCEDEERASGGAKAGVVSLRAVAGRKETLAELHLRAELPSCSGSSENTLNVKKSIRRLSSAAHQALSRRLRSLHKPVVLFLSSARACHAAAVIRRIGVRSLRWICGAGATLKPSEAVGLGICSAQKRASRGVQAPRDPGDPAFPWRGARTDTQTASSSPRFVTRKAAAGKKQTPEL
ncbi:hypothetical protein OJAV_G00221700 [Oryzias javanicus]|uniref:Uncharacterized protein n=1 Tax=Oryzias javanicus TaxID=123683 RepID=A0A437C169_ORYJA|nr:hypothetical protein OJAV_G00221700 [Oryzias javanicus]